jgi:hypothetical protein
MYVVDIYHYYFVFKKFKNSSVYHIMIDMAQVFLDSCIIKRPSSFQATIIKNEKENLVYGRAIFPARHYSWGEIICGKGKSEYCCFLLIAMREMRSCLFPIFQ